MNAPFRFVIAKNSMDGLRIALRTMPADAKNPLVVMASGGTDCAFSVGYTTPPDYPGINGFCMFGLPQLSVPVKQDGVSINVILPSTHSFGQGCAALLDRLRLAVEDYGEVVAVLGLHEVETSLPPLQAEDLVEVWWELRDHLGPDAASEFQYLVERVEDEGATFAGPRFYLRRADSSPSLEKRRAHLEEALAVSSSSPVTVLA